MLHEKLARLVIVSVICCVLRESLAQGAHTLETKVSLLLREEPENPKCFAEGWRDLTCFWEEDKETASSPDHYTFTYTYLNEKSNSCNVTSWPAVGGKQLFLCRLSYTQCFVPLDVQVQRDGQLIHNRSFFMDLVFLLDPPANLTVSSTDQQGQLRVNWRPPLLKYIKDNMMYEVSYAPVGSHVGKVEEVLASSELILRDLKPGTRYQVSVRVKLDGISYSGYWSAWATPVFMETLPAVLDPLILSLSIIISVILTLLSLTVLLYYRRFLLKKVWPVIPTPDSKFQGLFTVYGGDFKEWLGNSNRGLWLAPAFFYSYELPAPVEVLSEISLGPPLPTSALHPKASEAPAEGRDEEGEDEDDKRLDSEIVEEATWRESKNDQWLMEQLRSFQQHPTPRSQSSLLESQDTYVTLNTRHPSGSTDEPLNDILEETLPLEVLFAAGRSSSESRSDLGSLQQSSGSGRLSSQSSFEYPNHTWPPKGPGYTYMGVADSGISMDYSPMSSSRIDFLGKGPVYTNEYKNQIPAPHRRAIMAGQPIY
uniref:Erythropoietin receptor n=1 Tax=Plecoglossus altivelis TaxID=61084 RepID=A0A1L3GY98_PLEAT|nr:erythropoietin receptor [Plecoglossus altivelis]